MIDLSHILLNYFLKIPYQPINTPISDRRDGRPGSLFWFTFPYRNDDTALSSRSRLPRLRTVTSGTGLGSFLPQLTSSMSLPTSNTPLLSPLSSGFHTARSAPLRGDGQGHGLGLGLGLGRGQGQGQRLGKLLPSKRILLIDDTPSIIKMVGRLLQVTPPSSLPPFLPPSFPPSLPPSSLFPSLPPPLPPPLPTSPPARAP